MNGTQIFDNMQRTWAEPYLEFCLDHQYWGLFSFV